MSLKGKVALVTGGGKSLCAERAIELAGEGASLALHYSSIKSKDETARFHDDLTKMHPGIKVSIHAGDLGTAAAVEKLFSETIDQHQKIDIVVNTVGMVLNKPASNNSGVEYDKMFAYAVFVDEQRRRCVDQFRAESARSQRPSS